MGSSSMTTSAPIASFVCFVISIATFHICFCNGISSSFNPTHNNITCFENEREALVKFKQDLKDPSNRLSSWDTVDDCCRWAGVVCDNLTGHVQEIRLRLQMIEYPAYLGYQLRGKVNPSLLDLKHLQYLDLSNNNFEGAPIPSFIGSIATLRYLNLSLAGFGGTIPPQLGNITTFRYLDLGDNSGLRAGNLQWLAGLVSLQHLDMSSVDLSKALDWLQVTSNLPSLVELHLSGCQLKYVVSPSSTDKINFTSLDILDLSSNDLGPSNIPGWILSLNNLVTLDLSRCSFSGPVTCGLQNMTSLRVLDLSFNSFNSTIPNWLYSLSHLESLSLFNNNLQGVISISIENLTSLVSLDLASNQLQGSIPTSLGKLCKLKTICLYLNRLIGEVADVLIGFSRCKSHMLEVVSLFGNRLLGLLPDELGQLKNLQLFVIGLNSFSGPIPVSIGRLSSLKWLGLSYNKFNRTIPESFGQLAKLESLAVNDNMLEGVVSDVNFANLTRLRRLVARGNSITLKASENWVPPFQIEELNLDSWLLGPQFPLWLPSQRKLTVLSIANTGISGSIPTLFWPIFSKLHYASLSRNQICGEIPSLPNVEGPFIDLSSNRLNGSLPLIPSNLQWLDLSNNSFSGSIYHVLCVKGEKPYKVLSFLNLGNNLLSGHIPDCWNHWPELQVIILENNNLVGGIPSSMGQLQGLQSLHLRHNNLSGELPQTLQNCSSLAIIDLSENRFTGNIPPWMGNALLQLVVLNLRSNNFWGDLAYELCCLSSLQILDIAFNNISGHVPRCLANFSAMAEIRGSDLVGKLYHTSYIMRNIDSNFSNFQDNAFLVTKGRDVEYSTTLRLVKSMDLSENKLSGEIPEELTKLLGLWSLNLSGNHLTGRIPRNIGDMRRLESVDFSRNQLSGAIPSSLSSLTFLSHLNLSYNNLTGTIPSSTQLQLMNESSFLGNKLCGPPLPRCKPNKTIAPNVVPRGSEEEGDRFSEALFFASVALGFAVGFWVVLGPLLFKRSWRIAYFKVIEDIWNKVCDFIFKCRYMFRKRE